MGNYSYKIEKRTIKIDEIRQKKTTVVVKMMELSEVLWPSMYG